MESSRAMEINIWTIARSERERSFEMQWLVEERKKYINHIEDSVNVGGS